MPAAERQNKKGFFAKVCDFFKDFVGPGCACNCLKTAWERQAKELAIEEIQEKSERPKSES